MQLALNIDAQRFIQNLQINNQALEEQVQTGLDKAFEELSKDGVIEQMIVDTAKKNILDAFSHWVLKAKIQRQVEEQISNKLSVKIEAYTTTLVDELAEKLNLEK